MGTVPFGLQLPSSGLDLDVLRARSLHSLVGELGAVWLLCNSLFLPESVKSPHRSLYLGMYASIHPAQPLRPT